MNSLLKSLENVAVTYRQYVANNPETVTQLEATIRVVSYFVAGRFEESDILPELVYSVSNLLSLFHDEVLRQAKDIKLKWGQGSATAKLLRAAAVLEHTEVILEVASRHLWGAHGRWAVVIITQITKACLRLILLLRHGSGLQTSPVLPALNRRLLQNPSQAHQAAAAAEKEEQGFELGQTGRVVRSLGAGGAGREKLKTPRGEVGRREADTTPTCLDTLRLRAEALHIARPLLHLGSCAVFGLKSWKPWIIAAAVDVYSLYSMGDTRELKEHERKELRKRLALLALYLLRSPCYDQVTRDKLLTLLRTIGMYIPLLNLVSSPLADYLPVWQKIYSYVWAL